jgi:predicted transcriptional regulator
VRGLTKLIKTTEEKEEGGGHTVKYMQINQNCGKIVADGKQNAQKNTVMIEKVF